MQPTRAVRRQHLKSIYTYEELVEVLLDLETDLGYIDNEEGEE